MENQHANCKICDRMCKITKNGTIANHGHQKIGMTNSRFCFGSGWPHDVSAELIINKASTSADWYRRKDAVRFSHEIEMMESIISKFQN